MGRALTATPVRLKHALRPLAFRLRHQLDRARRLVRPPQAWDGRHHPVLTRFEPWEGEADGRFRHDFLGIKTDPRFRPQFRPDPAGPLKTRWPTPSAGYFELVFVLEAVVAAAERRSFTALELGAGYGRWLVTAHRARRLSSSGSIRLVGVEMVERHVEWMHGHFVNNGIDPREHRLIHAAVSEADGEALYLPEDDPWLDFGQHVLRPRRPVARGRDNPGAVRVPAVGLAALLRELGEVDLLHADMQGAEGHCLPAAAEELHRRVGRLLVATHSRRIQRGLRGLLARGGWRVVFDFGCRGWSRTPYGDVKFLDGVLAAVNPAWDAGSAATSR